MTDLHPLARLPEEWQEALARRGETARYRGAQVFRWIWERGEYDTGKMTDLPLRVRSALADDGLTLPATVETVHRSTDGTKKLVLGLGDAARIESVLLPVARGVEPLDADAAAVCDEDDAEPSTKARVTQCVSTQVGCAMACTFCASGVAGLARHLDAAEIAAQVLVGRAHCGAGETLRHVVFMGMGEPLHNYEATARAVRLLSHPHGLALPLRRITISTSGLVPEIRRLGDDFGGEVGLAVSLHHADDAGRSALMPVNRRYGLDELMAALAAYPLPRRRHITIEYTLIDGVNDGDDHARALVRRLARLRVKVNLIPMNRIDGSALGPSPAARVDAFQRRIAADGIPCFVRRRRGDNVAAACGQLALAGAAPKKRRLPLAARRAP